MRGNALQPAWNDIAGKEHAIARVENIKLHKAVTSKCSKKLRVQRACLAWWSVYRIENT